MIKKVFLLVSSIFIFSLFNSVFCFASSNKLDSLKVDVYIKEDGSADVTQIWSGDFIDTNTTENYIPTIIDDYELLNFRVSENGKEFQNLGKNWDIKASKAEKKDKCGLHRMSGGYEMCWGIGDYGHHEYKLEYTISSLVKKYTDGSVGFNFQFVNDGLDVVNGCPVEVVLHCDHEINTKNGLVDMWAFGHDGEIFDYDPDETYPKGFIKVNVPKFYSRDCVIVMLKFNDTSWFNVDALQQKDKSFDDVVSDAFVGSSYSKKDYDESKKEPSIFRQLGVLLAPTSMMITIIICAILGFISGKFINALVIGTFAAPSIGSGFFSGNLSLIFIPVVVIFILLGRPASLKLNFDKKIGSVKKVPYWRDCPKQSELLKAYGCIKPNTEYMRISVDNIIAAMMMVFVDKGLLVPEKIIKTGFFNSKEVTDLRIADDKMSEADSGTVYGTLFNLLKKAAGSDGVLQRAEIKRIGHNYYYTIKKLQGDILNEGYQECNKEEFGDPRNINKLTEAGREYLQHLVGLKKYFSDFTLLNERDVQEVGNWKDILIYATLLDEADVVMKKLAILYPENVELQTNMEIRTICNDFSRNLNSGMKSYLKEQAAKTASSGGGGSSSRGGGGGHSGGGHGGGSR